MSLIGKSNDCAGALRHAWCQRSLAAYCLGAGPAVPYGDGTIGKPGDVVTAQTLSALYRTEVEVEETPSGRRVCVPVWQRARETGRASGPIGE